ncbi:N-acetylmuramoyl-L-alanine amidase [Rhizobium leguminosarum]|uniref:N-acetylmuramoyl-L-alanine amidase n=1 Tax=Rhizobium leguminosarum TaxID=384 RepID=UPI0010401803|nr:N-acetylmuramoyl-L-alanine amidase [Rhizobium leguminosarum]NKK29611.1 hypothetical protein [Rhizobium leguminosarum bv. viciae]QIO61596.1 N-acetylmuramoyl-L-alanine amidase [Rhizobium leguminosarum bv. trifolii]TBZ54208.1 N-acetylmuramoyl-L-alanine amidase [Rhizobium leguminosarum bv. viciae]
MISDLSDTVMRQWIPKARPKREGAPPPRPGTVLAEVKKIVVGDTGWRGLTAASAAGDLGQAYGHFIVDDKNIIECVPAVKSSLGIVERACFVQSKPGQEFDAQECAITINLCFGGQIAAKRVYVRCVALVAFLCDRFDLDPAEDVKRAGDLDIARKDPDQALQAAGVDFQTLLGAVAEELGQAAADTPPVGSAAAARGLEP